MSALQSLLRSSDRRSSSPRALAGAGGSSRGVPLTFRDLCTRPYRAIGFAIPPWPRLSAAFAVFQSRASAGEVASPASVSPGLAPPSEFHQSGPLVPSRGQPLPWGSVPYSACDRGSPLRPGLPRPVRCAFRVRQPSWRLSSATTSTALFHAAHARGVCPTKLFPSRGGGVPLGAPLPTCRRLERHPASATCLARLLGFAPPGSPSRRRREVPPPGSMLPWASPSPGVSSRPRRSRLPANLLPRAWRGPRIPHLPLGVSIVDGPVRLRRDHRPS
jgi:hypothetical protein